MGRTPVSMMRLARWLRRQGHHPRSVGYLAAVQPFDAIVDRVYRHLARLAAERDPYVVIGHSLGGVVARAALARHPALTRPPAHLIMLGTPNRVPRIARRLVRLWPYRWVNGDSGARLADDRFYASLPSPSVPYTIVAGTAGRRGRWSVFGEVLNDGTVAVMETRVTATDQPIEVAARHTFLMNHRQVRTVIHRALDRVGT
jgi:pimeloyl-ACP methyl ester carboxylesterase